MWLLFGNAAATAVLTFAGWLAVAHILRPVGVLVRAMDATEGVPRPIADTDIPRSDPGLARLIATYNRMTTTVEARAEAERRLAMRERFVSLGRLSSSLAHEINNPLGGLLNYADTIVTYADRPEWVRESGNLMLRGLTHLQDVARAILDQNRLDQNRLDQNRLDQNRLDRTGQPLQAVDFEDLRLLFEPEAISREQRLGWQITAGDATLAALPSAQVRQVTLNLLVNASGAAGTGGRVGLSVSNGADVLSITVDDTGPGLGPDHLARLLSSALCRRAGVSVCV